MTGIKESLLVEQRLSGLPPADTADADSMNESLILPSQSEIDDPSRDVDFADHPLTVVRSALRWLAGSSAPPISITNPISRIDTDRVTLPEIGVSVVPLPRFHPHPHPESLMGGLVPFTRQSLSDIPTPLFDLWRVPDFEVFGQDRQQALQEYADTSMNSWTSQGVTDLQLENLEWTGWNPTIELVQHAQFAIYERPQHSVICWRLYKDDFLLRVTVGGSAYVSLEDMKNQLAEFWLPRSVWKAEARPVNHEQHVALVRWYRLSFASYGAAVPHSIVILAP